MGINEQKTFALETKQARHIEPVLGLPLKIWHQSSRVRDIDRWLAQMILTIVGNPPVSIVLWSKEEVLPPMTKIQTRLYVKDRGALLKLFINPELHFGDLYTVARIKLDGDLVSFLEASYHSIRKAKQGGFLWRLLLWLNHRPRHNTLLESRSNISHHYNIGNAFYELWLDRAAMQYTCAYFPDPKMCLEAAQMAKLHHVCRKLRLKPDDTVVEAGCGWGGLARFMAKYYGVSVKAYNISHEQVVYARKCAEQDGLTERVQYIEDDYRNITGSYNVFVSIGMLEHVGIKYYKELGGVISRCLKLNGRGLIHTIGRRNPGLMNQWIEKRIFPGACPPSLSQTMAIFEPYALAIQDVENLRLHYAKTLEQWLERFESNLDKIEEMFDMIFVRAWRLYLAGSIATFTSGELQLFQIVFTRPLNNNLPWSRKYIYTDNLPRAQNR